MTRKGWAVLFLGVAALALSCNRTQATPQDEASPSAKTSSTASGMTEDEKAVYALGAMIGQQALQQAKRLDLTSDEVEILKKAVAATLAGEKPEHSIQQYGQRLQARASAKAAREKQKGAAFREAAEKEEGAVKTASGLVFKTLQAGSGAAPKQTDVVRVHYRGTFTDGTEFDASAKRGGPARFPLNGVIPCWTEGVGRMKVGEKARFVCPSEIAYGDLGQGEIPPGATLVFEVELLGIEPGNPAAGTPNQ